jgi:hypothetical protein
MTSEGAWYSIEGTGKYLYATTCTDNSTINGDLDTVLSVWSGACSDLQLVGLNDDSGEDNCQLKSSVSFFAAEDTQYHILVEGVLGGTGPFALQVREATCDDGIQNGDGEAIDCGGSNCEPCLVPENDACLDAIPLEINEIVQGKNRGATSEVEPACGDESASLTADVWYSIEGTGEELIVTTCMEDPAINGDLDTQLTIFSGSCVQLQCIGGNDDDFSGACSLKSTVSFLAAEGTRYYILVHGFGGETGSFALQVLLA